MINRNIAQKLCQLLENNKQFNNVILIEGARQVGKTTLIQQVVADLALSACSFNLEKDPRLVDKIDHCESFAQFTELLAVDYKFRPGQGTILVIDEAQESRKLGSFVRFMKEDWPYTQVILSGSIMARLFRDDIRYPVGRVTPLHVSPFSFEEFLRASKEEFLLEKIESFALTPSITGNTHERLLTLLDRYMTVGGLPAVVTASVEDPTEEWRRTREIILAGYYNDFKRVYGEEKQAYFVACLKATAHLLGAPFKNSYVASVLDGGRNKTIINALSQLEAWKMILTVDQRGSSVETHFHPKRYLFDLGIAKHLRESILTPIGLAQSRALAQYTAVGGLVENMVCQALFPENTELAGWKKSTSGSEVDFISRFGETILPIECKSAVAIKNSHLGGLRDFMRLHHLSMGVVVSLSPFEIRTLTGGEQIVIMPLYLIDRLASLSTELQRMATHRVKAPIAKQ